LPEPPKGKVHPHVRLLNRFAFGPSSADLLSISTLGMEKWLEAQLAAKESEDWGLVLQLRRLDALVTEAYEARNFPQEDILRQLQMAALLRATYSRNQLYERMVEFWSDHFNIYGRKGLAAYRLSADGRDVIRAHALGNFGEMLMASAKSPAMLMYLDNHFNQDGAPNENYAREIMELHTLGVDGGYTQQDVMEVSRCFSGWGLETGSFSGIDFEEGRVRRKGSFRFYPERHDGGIKTVLGKTFPPNQGAKDGERVVKMLAQHPATARNLSKKACLRFLGLRSPKVEKAMAAAFLKSGGNIREWLSPLLLSTEIIESPPVLKRPMDLLVSSLRGTGARTDGGAGLQERLRDMGQPLYQWPMPDGYPDDNDAWSSNILARWNFAMDLAEGRISGTTIEWSNCDAKAALLGPDYELPPLEPGQKERSPQHVAALCLMAPDFQWK
jgi:uncharacterized protein (DUF1800 family)